jgi:photosystem II stability/assembly factor-like uncharacterized protein
MQIFAQDQHDINTLYVRIVSESWRDDTQYGIFRSVDGGQYFRKVDYDFNKLWISPLDRDLMYAWADGKGIYRSTDGGQHWKKTESYEFFTKEFEVKIDDEEGKPIILRGYPGVQQIAFDSSNEDRLYVISTMGILKTADGGKRWQPLDIELPKGAYWSAVLVVNPKDGRKLYLASDYDLRRSEDGGRTWRILPTPELPKLVNAPQ